MVIILTEVEDHANKWSIIHMVGSPLPFTNWFNFVILQIRADVVKNLGSLVITNWAKWYYKLIQELEIKATAIKKGDSY